MHPEALAYYRLEQLSKLKAKYGVEYLDPESETIDFWLIQSFLPEAGQEELTDPGDWEQLKRELDQNQDLIVSSQVDTSFASTLAPWS